MIGTAKRAVVCGAALALLALSACTPSSTGSSSPSGSSTNYVSGGTFKVSTSSAVVSFNPYSSFGAFWSSYSYDSLVHQAKDGSVVSGLASRWQITAQQATFTLRPGITCQDGATLSAGDVATALQYVTNPKNLTKVPGALYFLPSNNSVTVSADAAAHTVTVKTAKPFSFIDRTVGLLPIVCPKGLDNVASLDHGSDGTGPYTLDSYHSGGPYTMHVRPKYAWGPGGAATSARGIPRTIVISVDANSTTAANQLITGELNAATVNGADAQRLTSSGTYRFGAPSDYTLNFNEKAGRATADPIVRKALAAALDRGQVAKVATASSGGAAASMQPLGSPCYATTTSGTLPNYDLSAAKKLLDNDGWQAGSGGTRTKNGRQLQVSILTGTSYGATLPATAEFMAQQWKQLGVKATVSTPTGAGLAAADQDGNWDTMLISSYVSVLPSYFVTAFSGPGLPAGENYGSIHNAEFETLANKAVQLAGQASCASWNDAERALLRRVDTLPIADDTVGYFGHNARYTVAPTALVPAPTSIRLTR